MPDREYMSEVYGAGTVAVKEQRKSGRVKKSKRQRICLAAQAYLLASSFRAFLTLKLLNFPLFFSIQFFAGEIKKRGRESQEHDQAEEVAGCKRTEHLRTKSKKVRAPGQTKHGRNPLRYVRRNLLILQQIDNNSQQAENASCGNQTAGVEGSRTSLAFVLFLRRGFDSHANKPARKHCRRGSKGQIGADSKGERANAKNFDRNHQRYPHQDQTPWQALAEDAVDHRGHQACLRGRRFITANALRPLKFNPFGVRIIEILPVGNLSGTKSIDEDVILPAMFEGVSFHFDAGRQGLHVEGDLRGDIFFESFVHQAEGDADSEGGYSDANQQAPLLAHRSGAHEIAGF